MADGAAPGDIARDVAWYQFGGYKVRADAGLPGVILTRPFLEAHIRQRVLGLPNVSAIQEADVQGLHASDDRGRVLGIALQRRGGQPEQLLADLTVDATGRRGAQSPKWLEALGYTRPDESSVKINVGYTSRLYPRQPGDNDALAYMIATTPPQGKRYASMFAVEGQRWIVTLIGYLGDHAPSDEAGFLEFARSLPTPDIYQRLQAARPLTEIGQHKFPANLRRHYEKMARFPDGYIVLGDAVCSFNPIYGQGMTVAALEAITLGQCLRDQPGPDHTGLPAQFFKRVTPLVDVPWTLATGEDLRYPEVEGPRPRGAAFINRYVVLVHRAAMTDPVVCRAFFRVANLNEPPASLFYPALLARVLRANRGGRRAAVAALAPVQRPIAQ